MNRVVGKLYPPRTNSLTTQTRNLNTQLVTSSGQAKLAIQPLHQHPASGTWRAVHRVLARISKGEADQARQAQLARLQAIRMLLWNQAGADPIRAAQALIKLKAQEARLLGLDMP